VVLLTGMTVILSESEIAGGAYLGREYQYRGLILKDEVSFMAVTLVLSEIAGGASYPWYALSQNKDYS